MMTGQLRWWPTEQWAPLRQLLVDGQLGMVREVRPAHPQLDLRRAILHRAGLRETLADGLLPLVIAHDAVLPAVEQAKQEGRSRPDLLAVYQGAQTFARFYKEAIYAWELMNEPDIGFYPHNPDRAAAVNRALYLGLKTGSLMPAWQPGEAIDGPRALEPSDVNNPKTTPVLQVSLAYPPGPWAWRAARNGLFQVGDGYNFHYYGRPEVFKAAAHAHETFLANLQEQGLAHSGPWPLWLPEVNFVEDVTSEDINAPFRLRNAERIAQAARDAHELGLAAFMPFASRWPERPSNLEFFTSDLRAYPAWDAYRETIEALGPLKPEGGFFHFPEQVSPILMQWVPRPESDLPHKVSGSYRFPLNRRADAEVPWQAIEGHLEITNLADDEVSGSLYLCSPFEAGEAFSSSEVAYEMSLAPLATTSVPVTFYPPSDKRYSYRSYSYRFEVSAPEPWANAPAAHLFFAVETDPDQVPLKSTPLQLSRALSEKGNFSGQMPRDDVKALLTDIGGPWVGLHGLVLHENPEAETRARYPWTARAFTPEPGALMRHRAVAKLPQGLPAEPDTFLVLRMPPGHQDHARPFVLLIDEQGQRFGIVEDRGQAKDSSGGFADGDLYLRLADFHPVFFGQVNPEEPDFNPVRVREIQILFRFQEVFQPFHFGLELAQPQTLPKPKTTALTH